MKESYPGVHSMEAQDADEVKTFIQHNVSGSNRMRLIIFRAGFLPPQHGSHLAPSTPSFPFWKNAPRAKATTWPTTPPHLIPAPSSSVVIIIIRGAKTNPFYPRRPAEVRQLQNLAAAETDPRPALQQVPLPSLCTVNRTLTKTF